MASISIDNFIATFGNMIFMAARAEKRMMPPPLALRLVNLFIDDTFVEGESNAADGVIPVGAPRGEMKRLWSFALEIHQRRLISTSPLKLGCRRQSVKMACLASSLLAILFRQRQRATA